MIKYIVYNEWGNVNRPALTVQTEALTVNQSPRSDQRVEYYPAANDLARPNQEPVPGSDVLDRKLNRKQNFDMKPEQSMTKWSRNSSSD